MRFRVNTNPLYIISWITFIGFSLFVILIGYLGFSQYSRFITVPLRFGVVIFMLIAIVLHKFKPAHNSSIYIFFSFFFFFYFIKVIVEIFFGAKPLYAPGYEFILYSILYSIVPFFYFSQRKTNYEYNLIFNAIYHSGIVFSIFSILIWIQIIIEKGTFLKGLLPFSSLIMSYSTVILLTICISKLLFEKLDKKNRKKMYVGIAFAIIPFLISGSRGAMLALFVSLFLGITFFSKYKIKFRYILIGLFSFVSVIILASIIYPNYLLRFIELFNKIGQGESANVRIDIWITSLKQFLSSPIYGDSIQTDLGGYSHNIWIEALMSTGLIGFIPLALLTVSGFIKGVNVLKLQSPHSWIVVYFFQGIINAMFSGNLYSSIDFYVGLALVFSISMNTKDALAIDIKKS
ncbi:MAG TPA: O-antigen ligase family protein [Tenuifilaceae bacterium]|nr:O-antigen ligase family protein [Tenuifilaceae bacterium]